ncbi:NAD(P)-binding oxidoreductase [Amycolatopsis sp.]|jgi:putative NADH-flavin reductase|uniref:NAD(P)-dependent oxidoreductase n=1 Tax=Amycolatopsis sp. TaxID=37632 RepID=UPI002DFEEE4F|nr:NAD(P)-binding oxidoreductase [Amycolatopsis sp.]
MKITVFGATGGIGGHVVRQALEAGQQVTAVVRDPARLDVRHERLDVVTADVMDPAAIADAVKGRDAVITSLGARDLKPSTVARDSARSIMAAMTRTGTRRLLVVSNSGMIREGDGFFVRTLVKPVVGRVLREPWADMAAMEELIFASDLDWTIVRPPRLTDGELTGSVRSKIGANPRGFTVARADVADFLLKAVDDDTFSRFPVSIAG